MRRNIRVHLAYLLSAAGFLAVALATLVSGASSSTKRDRQDASERGFRAGGATARAKDHEFVPLKERSGRAYETPAEPPEMDPHPQRSDDAEFSDELLDDVADIFNEIAAVGGRVDTGELRNELADRLLATDGGSRLLELVVTDPDFARRSFGAHQAEARHFAAFVLGRGASQGSTVHLRSAIIRVSSELHRDNALDPSRAEDLRALLIAYTNAPESQTITASSLGQIGYDAHMEPAMRRLYQEALLFGFWRHEGYEAAHAHLKALFPET